jgi:hypothetical protein
MKPKPHIKLGVMKSTGVSVYGYYLTRDAKRPIMLARTIRAVSKRCAVRGSKP